MHQVHMCSVCVCANLVTVYPRIFIDAICTYNRGINFMHNLILDIVRLALDNFQTEQLFYVRLFEIG